jgi:hypothetical protein
MIFSLTVGAAWEHAVPIAVTKERVKEDRHKEISTYPTMYERVVNQLFSTESKSIYLPNELCAQVGLEQHLPVRPASVRKSTNPILSPVLLSARKDFLGGGNGAKRREGS